MNDEKVYERKNQQLLQSVYRMNRTEWYGYSQSILTHQYDERITLFVFSHLAGSSWPHDICHRTYIWHLVFNMRKKNVHYQSQIGRQLSTLTNSWFYLEFEPCSRQRWHAFTMFLQIFVQTLDNNRDEMNASNDRR